MLPNSVDGVFYGLDNDKLLTPTKAMGVLQMLENIDIFNDLLQKDMVKDKLIINCKVIKHR